MFDSLFANTDPPADACDELDLETIPVDESEVTESHTPHIPKVPSVQTLCVLYLALETPAHSDTTTTATLQEIESVKQTLATMSKTLQEVQHSANNFPQPDPRPIDQLISRLQAFEDQTIQRTVTDPIIRQLILLHGLLPAHDSMEDIPVVKAIRASVTDMLNIHGVSEYHVPGDRYNSLLQRCIGHEERRDGVLANTIAKRVRVGFRSNDTIYRHEEVLIYPV